MYTLYAMASNGDGNLAGLGDRRVHAALLGRRASCCSSASRCSTSRRSSTSSPTSGATPQQMSGGSPERGHRARDRPRARLRRPAQRSVRPRPLPPQARAHLRAQGRRSASTPRRGRATPAEMVSFLNGIGAGEADVIVAGHPRSRRRLLRGPRRSQLPAQRRPLVLGRIQPDVAQLPRVPRLGQGDRRRPRHSPIVWWQVPFGVPSATAGRHRRPLPRQPRPLHLQPHRRVRRRGRPRRHLRHRRRQPDVHHDRRQPVQERGDGYFAAPVDAAVTEHEPRPLRSAPIEERLQRARPAGHSPRPEARVDVTDRAGVDEARRPRRRRAPRARSNVTNGSLRLATTVAGKGRRSSGSGEKPCVSGGVHAGESTSAGATSRAPRTRERGPARRRRARPARTRGCARRERPARRRRRSRAAASRASARDRGGPSRAARRERGGESAAPRASASARDPSRRGRG